MTGWDSDEDAVRRRIGALIRERPGVTCASLSLAIGKNRAYIQQYLKRGQPQRLRQRDRIALASCLGVRPSELGVAAAPGEGFGESPAGDILFIPLLQDGLRGFGEQGLYPFRRDQLDSLGAACDRLALHRICGDAMLPTLADGDLALIDCSVTEGRREGLYLILAAGMHLVRRITANPLTGHLRIRADNPMGESPSECAPERVHILGRVLWAGRKF